MANPVKIRVIWQRKFYFYKTGVDLTEEEFKEYHTRKDLKNNLTISSTFQIKLIKS
jgi:hypothetical protein